MSIQQRFLSTLQSDFKNTFLMTLGHRLAISARICFTKESPNGFQQAQACNEMAIVIWIQLLATKNEETEGFPDTKLLSILLEKADSGEARWHLRNAIESALTVEK